jgi:8-oxo-dGTP diphosphatase
MEFLTTRLRLRSLQPSDAADLVAHLNDWEVARWLARPPYPYTAADADEFIAFAQAHHAVPDPLLFAIANAGTNRLMGVAGIETRPDGAGELGYWLGRSFWGRGYGQEAALATIARARAAGIVRFVAFVHRDNLRSRGLLERCGFRPAGTSLRQGRDGELLMRRFVLQPHSRDGCPESGAGPASAVPTA